jgi:hypothetical protein
MHTHSAAQFEAELILGHKGITAVIVPFNPEEKWSRKPVRLASRRHGWLVTGAINGVQFDSYIGERWGRFFIIIGPEIRQTAALEVGDKVKLVIQPSTSKRVYEQAFEQSKLTTQPRVARPDAIEPKRFD